jgi:hypothetical protein
MATGTLPSDFENESKVDVKCMIRMATSKAGTRSETPRLRDDISHHVTVMYIRKLKAKADEH